MVKMCNKLHKKHLKIKESGYGYKIVRKYRNVIRPMFWSCAVFHHSKVNIWNPAHGGKGSGFCFFLTKNQAIRYLNQYSHMNRKIYKIKYSKGLGRVVHQAAWGNPFSFSICKRFEFIEAVDTNV
jgi:hypothetical protein